MSKENTKKFFDDVATNETLKTQLLDSPAQAWVSSAKTAGLDITVEEVADELIVRVRGLLTGELRDDNLDAVSGGAGPTAAIRKAQISTPIAKVGAMKPVGGLGGKFPGGAAGRW